MSASPEQAAIEGVIVNPKHLASFTIGKSMQNELSHFFSAVCRPDEVSFMQTVERLAFRDQLLGPVDRHRKVLWMGRFPLKHKWWHADQGQKRGPQGHPFQIRPFVLSPAPNLNHRQRRER